MLSDIPGFLIIIRKQGVLIQGGPEMGHMEQPEILLRVSQQTGGKYTGKSPEQFRGICFLNGR